MHRQFFDAITIYVSKLLEALFDDLEYRLAKRAFRHAAKAKIKRRSRTKVLNGEVIATSSKGIYIEAA